MSEKELNNLKIGDWILNICLSTKSLNKIVEINDNTIIVKSWWSNRSQDCNYNASKFNGINILDKKELIKPLNEYGSGYTPISLETVKTICNEFGFKFV